MSEITRRAQLPLLPDISGLIDPFQVLFGWKSPADAYGIRIEAHFEDGTYVVRAELPGIDPAKDVEVTVTDDLLTIRAERAEQTTERHHSEFRYGSFSRSLRLPEGAKTEKAAATYKGGILEIRIEISETKKAASHKIKVQSAE
ncbi:MAG TPA: Hsp20/alpha crystallin family protein [Actinocrinis sp.]|nr:Hsp20/alpha crystallin family protein [Actinocrinis sp.]